MKSSQELGYKINRLLVISSTTTASFARKHAVHSCIVLLIDWSQSIHDNTGSSFALLRDRKLEHELIQNQMRKEQILRAKAYARALLVHQNHEKGKGVCRGQKV